MTDKLKIIEDALTSLQRYDGTLTGEHVKQALAAVRELQAQDYVAVLDPDDNMLMHKGFLTPNSEAKMVKLYAAPVAPREKNGGAA